MNHKCDYADERDKKGYCEHKGRVCNGCGDLFVDIKEHRRVYEVRRKSICKESSPYGNYYIKMNAQDVANLISGKCLAITGGEYSFFLSYDGGMPDA